MKIVHYLTWLSRSAGGLLTAVSGLAKASAELGTEVAIVGGADRYFEQDRSYWGNLPVFPHDLRMGAYGLDRRALGLMEDFKPDILHVNGIWTAASLYGLLATFRGISVVVSPHGMLDPWILARKPAVKTVHATLFERPLLRRAHVHTLAEAERQAVIDFMPSTASRIFTLPNGVPAVSAEPAATARKGVLYLGRLHEKKQTLELISAWRAAPALAGHPLTIAGWGDPDYEAQVKAAAAATPGATFVGSLYGEAKAAALSQARFFILPSLSEGLPMAVLEALQYGCVPIITDACNLPELFVDDIALRMQSDFSDFAAVVGNALASDETQRSSAARAYARRYLWSSVAERMLAQYQTILDAKGGRTIP